MDRSPVAPSRVPEHKLLRPRSGFWPAGAPLQPPARAGDDTPDRSGQAPERKNQVGDLSRLAVDCELKFTGEEDGKPVGLVSGYASVFGVLDRGGDIVQPGAFKKTLAEWRKRKAMPPLLWQHDSWQPIGICTLLEEDEKGLRFEAQLVLEVPQAAQARALIQAKAVRATSIGYQTRDSDIDRNTGARLLKQVDLWEISLATFPMLPEALLTGVKNDAQFDPRLWEQAFRDEGLSTREAKLAVSVVRKQALRDEGQTEPTFRDGAADVLMALRKATIAFRA